VAAAAATLEGALATAFAASAAAPGMESAFAAFAATVGTGMAPAFVATPPAGQVGFATQFLAQPATHALAAAAISGLIDTWMKTGSATPSGGGAPVPWT
jgi:heme/copper-type cytochrome/quinol oxidase subunit 1